MASKRQKVGGNKPSPLVDRYTYVTSIKAGQRTLAWLAIDRTSKRVVVAAPVGKERLLSLKKVRGLQPGHLAPIVRLLRTPERSQLPPGLGSVRPVGIAIAEYVPGDTLHAVLKHGKLPPDEAVNTCIHVVRAVMAMHEAGTAHGAISPRAIVVSPKGKWSAPVVTQLIAPTSGAYSSRERLQKKGASVEDDSWAAHATLHAALTAEGPFAGTTREELLQNMFGGKPRRLDEFGVDEPELQKIIDAGLVTNPRYRASLPKLLTRLEKWLEERGKVVQSVPPVSDQEPMFPKDDAPAIMLSEPPPPKAGVVMPRPYGKSLVGIVIDEPIDADAPAFTTPQRPEDLLDAVDDDDEKDDEDDDEDEPTTFYDASAGKYTGPGRPSNEDSSRAEDKGTTEPTESGALAHEPQRHGRSTRSNRPASKKGSQMSAASGQALAAALALAVAALVTLFVRYQKDQQQKRAEAASVAGARDDTKECVSSFFPSGTFRSEESLDFVCEDTDLRNVVEKVEHRIEEEAHGRPSAPAKAWSELGWYQLALTASLRRNCCNSSGNAIKLPGRQDDCTGLAMTIQGTDRPARGEKLAAQTRDFERTATCFAQKGDESPYPYRSAPKTSSRKTFGEFLQRRAGQQASAEAK